MSTMLSAVITQVTSTFSSIVSWVPILFAAGFCVVKFGIGCIMRIIGARRRRRKG